MQIDYALIADHADIAGGKLYLNGGGWDRYQMGTFPAQLRLAVAVGIRVDWDETNRATPVRVTVEDDDGTELVSVNGSANVGRPPRLTPGSSQLIQMAVNVQVRIERASGFRAIVRVGDEAEPADTRVLPFRVEARVKA